MPEKKYPPRFDCKTMEADAPVEFTLLRESISRETVDDKGEKYWWHLYPVSYAGNEMSLFTPNDRVHAGLESLKIRPHDTFTLTKKLGLNTGTGKSFTYYEMTCDGQTIDTKDTVPSPAPKPEEDPLAGTPLIKEPSDDPIHTFNRYYGAIMTIKMDHIASHIDWEKLDDTAKLQTLWELDKSTSANVSTILIQNGGKR